MATDLPYAAEYAKTGRASCKGCKTPIPQASLRLAVMVQLEMALKRCLFRGCRSVHTPDNPSREMFFEFPKDETIYEIWMGMSRCEDKSKSTKYLCSKHFDHSKYMSSNPRRNLLLADAVPFRYQSDNEESEDEEEEKETDQLQDDVSTQDGDEDFAIQEPIVDKTGAEQVVSHEAGIEFPECTDSQQVEVVDQSDFAKTLHQQPEQRKSSKPEVVEYYRKRKLPESAPEEPSNVKIVKLRAVQKISSNSSKRINAEKVQVAEEELVNDPGVSTFIFKGEEYVQMRKKCYIEEKQKLQYYKDIAVHAKNLFENVKF